MAKKSRKKSGKKSRRKPSPWKWRAEWLAYVCFEKIAGLLPGSFVFRLGEIVGGFAWHMIPLRRKIVLRNLRIAFCDEHDLPTLEKMAKDTVRRTFANLFASAHTARLPGDRIDAVLKIENQDLIEHAMSGTPGLVLMPPHMGNWEILSRMNRLFPQGNKIGAFYRPLNNPLMNERVVAQRKTDGTYLFAKSDSLHHVTGFLREGSLIGVLADQRVGNRGELVRFFGRLTRASPLPSLLARRSKSEALTMSVVTESPGKWRVIYHPVERPFKTLNCMDSLERAMRASPIDVFWFQDRWRVYINRTHTIRDWLGPDTDGTGKPHRALLWLAGAPASWKLPDDWIHPDVFYEVVLAAGQAKPSFVVEGMTSHLAPAELNQKTIQAALYTMDRSASLPIDYILAIKAPKALLEAARRESIRLVSLKTK